MRRLFRSGQDQGMSMVMVVGSMMTLMVLVLGSLAYTMQSEKFARYDQDYTAAMAAAQSGVEDYISRLNRNDNYHTTVDCSNPALQGPTTQSNTCGWTATTPAGWSPVTPGQPVTTSPAYHYKADGSTVNTEGTVTLTSTGRSRDVYRTIEVAVGKGGSTDFVYYTDFESADPANKVSYPDPASVSAQCGGGTGGGARYFWQGRSGCREITFIGSDTLDGRTFTNDAFLSSNALFEQGIESANPACRNVTSNPTTWNSCLRSGSTARFGQQPKYSSALYLQDNSAAFADYPGCHYYGATRIVFNANGTMTVWSPDSNFSGANIAVDGPTGTPSCGSKTALASSSGATVPVPNDAVIYVAAAPTSGAGAVTRRQLYAEEIGGPTNQKLPLGTYAENSRNRTSNTSTYDLNMADPKRFRGEGNLYLQGVLSGRVTVAAAQSVIVTGDVVLASGVNGSDMLGLVATNSVEVMHPRMVTDTYRPRECIRSNRWGCAEYRQAGWYGLNERAAENGRTNEGTWPKRISDPSEGRAYPSSGVQIAGSIQTLQHSFFVQEYDKGDSQGTLLVRGSIAQRWRGAVGTGSGYASTGYSKLYTYDQRLRYSAPPYFPHWANAEWSLRYSGEIRTEDGVKS